MRHHAYLLLVLLFTFCCSHASGVENSFYFAQNDSNELELQWEAYMGYGQPTNNVWLQVYAGPFRIAENIEEIDRVRHVVKTKSLKIPLNDPAILAHDGALTLLFTPIGPDFRTAPTIEVRRLYAKTGGTMSLAVVFQGRVPRQAPMQAPPPPFTPVWQSPDGPLFLATNVSPIPTDYIAPHTVVNHEPPASLEPWVLASTR